MDHPRSTESEYGSKISGWWLGVAAAAALAFLIIIAYPSRFYFLNDDFIHIPLAATGSFSKGMLHRPVSDLTLFWDYIISGKNAYGFHLTNLLIHIINSMLLFIFCKKKLGSVAATAIAIIFLLYAFHSESVFWIIGRGGLLAGFFMLISLNLYCFSRSTTSLVFALTAFLVGLFSYESIWPLPALIAVLDISDSRSKKKSFMWTVGFTSVFFSYLIWRLLFVGNFLNEYDAEPILHFDLTSLIYNYATGFFRLFLPPLRDGKLFLGLSVLTVIALSIGLFYGWKKRHVTFSRTGVPLILLCTSLTPVITLGVSTHTAESERFLYVSSIFSSWLIAELVRTIFLKKMQRLLIFGLLIIYHTFFFAKSAGHYQRAGDIVRVSLNCIRQAGDADTLVAHQLPASYEGNFLLRKGFPEAVKWLIPGKFGRILIESQSSITGNYMPICVFSGRQSAPASRKHITWDANGNVRID